MGERLFWGAGGVGSSPGAFARRRCRKGRERRRRSWRRRAKERVGECD